MSLYLALHARLVQHSDDVLAGLSCVVPPCAVNSPVQWCLLARTRLPAGCSQGRVLGAETLGFRS